MAAQGPAKTDRQTTTPFLLRLFYKQGAFHRLDDFDPTLPRLPPHLQIYTWPTCTLRELSSLLLSALPTLLPTPYAGARIAFRLIFPDTQAPTRPGSPGRFISRDLGSIIVGASTEANEKIDDGGEGPGVAEALKQLDGDPNKSLGDAKFVIGDYVSCAIFPPLADGTVAPVPLSISGPSRGPPPRDGYGGRGRENGYGGRGDYGYGGRGDYGYGRGGRGGRYEDRRGGGFPVGEWRRGEAPPEREPGYGRGGWGGGRGRGRGRW